MVTGKPLASAEVLAEAEGGLERMVDDEEEGVPL